MNIPQNCINFFIDTHKMFPSFVRYQNQFSVDVIKKLTDKSVAVWVNKVITKDKNITLDNFLVYDSNGIMIYINNSDEIIDLVFLCTPDKIQNVELLLSQLKRIKK
jgi:hypothetical protein